MSGLNAKISYIFHPVPDLKLALEFFRDIMGFEVRYGNMTDVTAEKLSDTEISKLQWIEFNGGGITLLVQLVPGETGNIETGIGFEVENCDEAIVYLKNKGVVASPISGETGAGKRVFYIRDPFGNSFGVFGK